MIRAKLKLQSRPQSSGKPKKGQKKTAKRGALTDAPPTENAENQPQNPQNDNDGENEPTD